MVLLYAYANPAVGRFDNVLDEDFVEAIVESLEREKLM